MKHTLTIFILLSLFSQVNIVIAQQSKVIRGTISDSETKERIIGATVTEYNKDNRIIGGTISDPNGNFVLNAKNNLNVFRVSFIGYKTLEFRIEGRETILLELVSESIQMDEVMVVATSSRDPLSGVAERDVTGSRVKVDMVDSKHLGATSAEEALQGQISGVDIIAASGNPGSGSAIVIRGLSSLSGGRPLIVVDNVPQIVRIDQSFDFASADQEDIGDLVNIAPQDIKSIEVLKDASSTAIWGSRGANGVLLIQTHRGRQGKTIFEYQAKFTLTRQPSPIPMLNGNEYITMQLEELHNEDGLFTLPRELAYDRTYKDFYNYSANTDWVDAISRDGFINDHYFKLSGGGEKTRYFASVNYLDNKGTTINTSLKRITTRINLDYNVSTKIKFSVNFNYSNSFKEDNFVVSGRNIRSMAYIKAPNMSVWEYDSYGELTGEYFTPIRSYQGDGITYYNPVAVGNLSVNDREENVVNNSFILNYNMFSWLQFQQMISYQYTGAKTKQFLPYNAIGVDWINNLNNRAVEGNSTANNITSRSQLFFLPRFRNTAHSLSGVLTAEFEIGGGNWVSEGIGLGPSVSLRDAALHAPILWLFSNKHETRGMGFLGSLNYKLKDRYIVSVNARADGSSKFGVSQRWGLFPSFSLGWRFSSEEWMDNINWLSDGMIRAAWGQTGAQPANPYDRHAIYDAPSPNQYINNPIIVPLQVQLDNLKWETVSSWNLGIDIGLLRERITLTGELYNKVTEDILWKNYKVPNSAGFDNIKWYNGGIVQNQGWEFFTTINAIKKNGINLNFNFNIAQNFNSFVAFPENFNNEINTSIIPGRYPVKANLGQPIGSFYGFRYQGVWPSDEDVVALNKDGEVLLDIYGNPVPLSYKGTYEFVGGDARYEDINHDGKIDLNDVVYLGDSNPKLMGGFGTSLTWKQFFLSAQFLYRTGYQIVNMIAIETEGMRDRNNQSTAVKHRWTYQGQNDPGILPRAYMQHPANNLGSDRYVENGDFLRLNHLTLRYALKKDLCRRIRIRSLDMAVTMRKLFTLTNYSGQDPEIAQISDDPFWIGADRARTPPPKSIMLSLAIGF